MSWCSGWFCFMQPATATVLTFYIQLTEANGKIQFLKIELVDDRAQTSQLKRKKLIRLNYELTLNATCFINND